MPIGIPTAAQLLGKEVTFFSLDTNIIQAAGYKFDSGQLNTLPLQRPPWINICLTEVVEREVAAHRMKSVSEAVRQLFSASKDLVRLAGLDMTAIDDALKATKLEQSAEQTFEAQVKRFVSRLGGDVLPIDGASLAKEIFARYFDCKPPFETRKKDEFPDAAALLLLEQFAIKNKTKGILISDDKGGWAAFAHQSEYLYCVKSLDEFTALFESEGPNAETLRDKIGAALEDHASPVFQELTDRLQAHVSNAYWVVDDLHSNFNLRLEGNVTESAMDSCTLNPDAIRLWVVENDPTTCVVEISASVEVEVSVCVEFYQEDWVDHDEINVGSEDVTRTVEIEVDVLLTCSADLLKDELSDWDVSYEFARRRYAVDVGLVDPHSRDDEDRDW